MDVKRVVDQGNKSVPGPAPLLDKSERPHSKTPRYQVLQKCYHNERIYDPELQPVEATADDSDAESDPDLDAENQIPEAVRGRKPLYINFNGLPGPHLKPVNESAEAMCAKHKERMVSLDVINRATPLDAAPQDQLSLLIAALTTLIAKQSAPATR